MIRSKPYNKRSHKKKTDWNWPCAVKVAFEPKKEK